MILDTSAILALLFDEPHAKWVADQLSLAPDVHMSTVNLAECLIHLYDRKPAQSDPLVRRFTAMNIQFVAPDRAQAEPAARARLRFPINFGDCFAYALAKTQNVLLLTLDRDFRSTDIQVMLPPEP